MPERAIAWLIAHELAHMYQKVQGKSPGGETKDQNEDDANAIAIEWGFENERAFYRHYRNGSNPRGGVADLPFARPN